MDARRFAARKGLAARGTIFEHKANGIFRHRQGFLFIVPVRDNFGKGKELAR
jgi:hypothetical protein